MWRPFQCQDILEYKSVLLCNQLFITLQLVQNEIIITSINFSWHYSDKILVAIKTFLLLLVWHNCPTRARAASLLRFVCHTQWHNTIGRTPTDGWSARRRNLYLTTHTLTHERQISMTRNPNKRSAADPRLRQLGHRDRPRRLLLLLKYKRYWSAKTQTCLQISHMFTESTAY
jgi:hypothetical protein